MTVNAKQPFAELNASVGTFSEIKNPIQYH